MTAPLELDLQDIWYKILLFSKPYGESRAGAWDGGCNLSDVQRAIHEQNAEIMTALSFQPATLLLHLPATHSMSMCAPLTSMLVKDLPTTSHEDPLIIHPHKQQQQQQAAPPPPPVPPYIT